MHVLIVKRPWIDQLLDGTKLAERRSRPTKVRGRIGLAASGQSGQVLGTIELYNCVQVEGGWDWLVRRPVRLQQPVQFQYKKGCVVWCRVP